MPVPRGTSGLLEIVLMSPDHAPRSRCRGGNGSNERSEEKWIQKVALLRTQTAVLSNDRIQDLVLVRPKWGSRLKRQPARDAVIGAVGISISRKARPVSAHYARKRKVRCIENMVIRIRSDKVISKHKICVET